MVSGIVGSVDSKNKLSISQAYTLGNLYTANESVDGTYVSAGNAEIHSIYAGLDLSERTWVYYIAPENTNIFSVIGGDDYIPWDQRSNVNEYNNSTGDLCEKVDVSDGGIDHPDKSKSWRIYTGGLLILNDFLSNSEDYFSKKTDLTGIESVQYGTAYNPLLTIVTAKDNVKNLAFDWGELNVASDEDFVVHNSGLTLNNFDNNQGHYYAGTVYADGELNISVAKDASTLVIMDGAEFYGSSVVLNANGRDALISGLLQATGKDPGTGSVLVTSAGDSDFEILGQLNSAQAGATTTISGLSPVAPASFVADASVVNDPMKSLTTISDIYAINVNASDVVVGDVTVETEGQ